MWFAYRYFVSPSSCWSKEPKRWGERVPNPKIRAAGLTEADKSKLLLEEDLTSPEYSNPNAEPCVGQWLQLIQATTCPETGSAAHPGLPFGYRDSRKNNHTKS